jgi:hypothetical protein
MHSILGAWRAHCSVSWGERVGFCFVEKCSLSLYWYSIAQREREYLPTIFAPYMPPYGAGETAFALPSLDGQLSTGRTLTLSR